MVIAYFIAGGHAFQSSGSYGSLRVHEQRFHNVKTPYEMNVRISKQYANNMESLLNRRDKRVWYI
jgi:hypothetical protein